MKILAVDPGLEKIGLAVSDATGTVARALTTLRHQTSVQACELILQTLRAEQVETIILGSSHEPGKPMDEMARFTHRLLADLRAAAGVPVLLVDESFSTQTAQKVRRERGESKKKRRSPDDALAAAAFLQEYLDAQANQTK